MGTEIEANAFLRERRSVIDLDGSISNGIRSFHNENQIGRSNEDRGLFASYDLEKVRRTILEHESVFRNQIQELHRLYGRQRQLMNEIKWREINKHDDVKCQSSYMFSPHPREDAKRPRYPYHSSSTHSSVSLFPSAQDKSSLRICEPRSLNGAHNQADAYSRNTEKQASCNRDNRLWLSGVQSSQRKADDLAFDLFLKRNNNPGVISINNPTDDVSDRLALSRGEMCVNPFSNSNLVTKDFFQNSMDRKNGEYSPVILGSKAERSGKELLSDDYADKRRLNKHSDKPQAFPQSLLAEPKKELSTCPLDIGASVSRKRKKIFGVEICEEYDDPLYAASNKSSEFGRQKPYDENQRVFSSSWIANSFAQSLDLRASNLADGKSERSKEADNLDMNGKWLEGCSSVGSKFVEVPNQHSRTYFENFDNMKMPAEVLKKDSDCQNNQDEGLPWFLRSQVNDDQSKEKKNSYFMNLDSLQNCSKKFFGKDEVPDGTNGSSQLKEKTSEPMAAEGGTNEANDVTGAKKILGFLISDAVQGFKDLNSGENLSKVETNKGSNRHCIDLNLSLDDEDALSTPSPAVIKPEKDALPSVAESKKKGEKSELPSEERDNIAAEAMIAISLSILVNDDSLKWFAEIVSSQCGDALVEVPVNQSRAHGEEEDESVPDGMDYFEFMTLKLEDKGEKHYQYEPVALSDDEAGPTHTKRSRRGQSRRGRQRKDFQRDVLPGLTTLSRLQVKEDFQAFEELLKADGSSSWQSNRSSTRNGRGRKRSGGANSSPRIKTVCSAQAEQPICQLEGRCLAGWGKRTRRLPRQRCPNALLSFPVKC